MMKVLELMMMKNDLLKIMLTVFKHNDTASSFFKDVLKYEIDETCPYDTVYEQFDYEILSRYQTWYILHKLKIGTVVFYWFLFRFNAKEKKIRDANKEVEDCCEPQPNRGRSGGGWGKTIMTLW